MTMKVEKFTEKKHTKSVEEIAYLRFRGFKHIGPPVGDGRFKWACFEKTPQLEKAIEDFYNGSDAKRLFDELRNAKQFLLD